jgi:hypothetical protein
VEEDKDDLGVVEGTSCHEYEFVCRPELVAGDKDDLGNVGRNQFGELESSKAGK